MATCDLGYDHADPAPEPVIVPADPGPNEHDVEIAAIEAEASIKREELYTEQRALELESEVSRLRGELDGIKETLSTMAPPPPPEPEPVVIPVESVAPPAPSGETVMPDIPATKKASKDKGWWGGYGS